MMTPFPTPPLPRPRRKPRAPTERQPSDVLIRELKNGVAMFGDIPVPLLLALIQHYESERGLHLMDAVSCLSLGAAAVITSNTKIAAMRDEAKGYE